MIPLHDLFKTGIRLDPETTVEGYESLESVLCAAYAQASQGKGADRHAAGDSFDQQPIMSIGRLLNSADGEAYQAIKKVREGLRMASHGKPHAAIREVFGAINYLAAVALLIAEEVHYSFEAEGVGPDATPAAPNGPDLSGFNAADLISYDNYCRSFLNNFHESVGQFSGLYASVGQFSGLYGLPVSATRTDLAKHVAHAAVEYDKAMADGGNPVLSRAIEFAKAALRRSSFAVNHPKINVGVENG